MLDDNWQADRRRVFLVDFTFFTQSLDYSPTIFLPCFPRVQQLLRLPNDVWTLRWVAGPGKLEEDAMEFIEMYGIRFTRLRVLDQTQIQQLLQECLLASMMFMPHTMRRFIPKYTPQLVPPATADQALALFEHFCLSPGDYSPERYNELLRYHEQ